MSAVVLYAVAESLVHLLGGHALLVDQVHSKENKKFNQRPTNPKKKSIQKILISKIQMFPCHLNLSRAEISRFFFFLSLKDVPHSVR